MGSIVARYISEAESAEEKKKIYSNFRTTDWVPHGDYNPDLWPDPYSYRNVEKGIKEGEECFSDIIRSFGSEVPEIVMEDYRKFRKNSDHASELLKFDRDELRKMPVSNLFPYWADFGGVMKKMLGYGRSKINLEGLSFDPKPISRGGYGEVYPVSENGEMKYVLKLFFPSFFFNPEINYNYIWKSIDKIAENIASFFSIDEPFKSYFPDIKSFFNTKDWTKHEEAYLMDYFPGKNLRDIIENEKDTLNKNLVGKVLLNYASMLRDIHTKNYIYIDNALNSILVDEKENQKIIDIDFLTPVDKLDSKFTYPCHPESPFRESFIEGVAPTFSSDLESFSFMIHHLLFGIPFLEANRSNEKMLKDFALRNKREYPPNISEKLPTNLRQLVPALITYPRDDSIKAEDFVYAIEKDFFGS